MNQLRLVFFSCLFFVLFLKGYCRRNVSDRPAVVNIGSILAFDSIIGKVAKIAIEEAVKDVNSNPDILHGAKLHVSFQDSNCNGFQGMAEALRLMEKDIVAIIGPQCAVVAHIIAYVANELHVPLISFGVTDPTMSTLQFPYFVRTTQSDEYQMDAVSAIVDYYGWREVIVIFADDDDGRNGVAALNDKLVARRCRITYKAAIHPLDVVNKNDEIMNVLVKIMMMRSRVIVLRAYSDLGFRVFKAAKYLGMMGNGYVWITTDWLSTNLDSASPLLPEKMDTVQGVLALRQHTPDSDAKRAFLKRWPKISGSSLALNTYGLYAYDSVVLLAHALDDFFNHGGKISFSNDLKLNSLRKSSNLNLEAMTIFNGGEAVLNNILKTYMVGLTGQLQFTSDRSLTRPAYDILNVAGSGVRQVGYWSNYSGLSIEPPESLYKKPRNISSSSQRLRSVIWPGEALSTPRGWVFPNNGKSLKIGVPTRVSYKEFVSKVPGTDNSFKGFCIDVFTSAVNLLPYAVPYKFVPFGDGKKNPNYTNMVEMITTGMFDGVVGDVAIVTKRTKIADFTQPYAASGLVVVAPFRKMNSGAWAFLRPFNLLMWAVIACSFLFIGIVVWVLEHRINDEFRGPPERQVVTILWFSFSTMFFAHRENTISTLGRVVLIIWLFIVLIINSSYTASLTSILTVQQLSSRIKGIETLRKNNDPIGYQVGSFAEHYLRYDLNISESRLVPLGSPEAYAKALKDGPHKGGVAAIVDERPYVELFLANNCAFRVVGQEFTKSGWGFAFPRDSPLALDLSTAILELAENGDLQRIHDKWLIKSACNPDNTEVESERLHLKSFWGLFLICGIACLLALLIYFTQIIRQLCKANPDDDSVSKERIEGSSSSHSKHFQRLLSLMDEKEDPSKRGSKKRKVEQSISGGKEDGAKRMEFTQERGFKSINPLDS